MRKVLLEYPMATDGCQAAGAICLIDLGHEYVVWYRNDEDTKREGRPCYYFGDYCSTLPEAAIAFGEKCKRYDPTGQLHEETKKDLAA